MFLCLSLVVKTVTWGDIQIGSAGQEDGIWLPHWFVFGMGIISILQMTLLSFLHLELSKFRGLAALKALAITTRQDPSYLYPFVALSKLAQIFPNCGINKPCNLQIEQNGCRYPQIARATRRILAHSGINELRQNTTASIYDTVWSARHDIAYSPDRKHRSRRCPA